MPILSRPGKVQHRVQKRPAVAPPATSVRRHLCRHIGGCFPGQQFRVDGFGSLPVLELNRPHPMTHPLVQFLPDSRSLRQPEVSLPSQHIDSQLSYHLFQTASAGTTSPSPDTLFAPFLNAINQDVVIHPVEGSYDTLPIISTFPSGSRLFVVTIHSKHAHSRFSARSIVTAACTSS